MNAQSKSVLTMGELLWDMLPDGNSPMVSTDLDCAFIADVLVFG